VKRLKHCTLKNGDGVSVGDDVIGRGLPFKVERIERHEATGTTLISGTLDGKRITVPAESVVKAPEPVTLPADYPEV
jgi:hypothetical protein